jgi:hypothetical protein
MAHQPLGGRPVAVVNPNANRPGPLEDPAVSQVSRNILLGELGGADMPASESVEL